MFPFYFSEGRSKFFSEVISFREGGGSLRLDFTGLVSKFSRMIFEVFALVSYLGPGNLSLSCLRLVGNLMVFSILSSISSSVSN